MPSRRQQRRRNRTPGYQHSWGKGLRLTRTDLKNIRRAIKQGWDVPESTMQKIMIDIEQQQGDAGERLTNSMLKTLLMMESHNQELDQCQTSNAPPPS